MYGKTKELCQTHKGAEKSMENFLHEAKGQGQGEVNFINKKNKSSNKWKEQNWRTGENDDDNMRCDNTLS